MERIRNKVSIILILVSILLVTSGAGTILPPPSFETQGIVLSTDVSALGIFSNYADINWGHSSEVLGSNLQLELLLDPDAGIPVYDEQTGELIGVLDPETGEFLEDWQTTPEPPLNSGPVSWEYQMYTVYSEDTRAQYGTVDYSKTSEIETKAVPASMYNLENDRIITYTGVNGNRILSEEDVMISASGTSGFDNDCANRSSPQTTCPSCCLDCYPPFCTYVDTGSSIDMSVVSASTSAGIRNLNKEGYLEGFDMPYTIPTVDDPARVRYEIRVSELSAAQPSVGFVSAYLNFESKEGGTWCPRQACLAQDLLVKDRRSVDGYVSLFSNVVDYESGICC